MQYNADGGMNPPLVYAKKMLAPADFLKPLGALPLFPDVGIPSDLSKCIFDPHHKIMVMDAQGQETVIKVCFECDHLQINDGPILPTPFAWRQRLRDFFASEGMPDRGSDVYYQDQMRALNANGPASR